MVEIYADRVEITNPGKPLVPVERFIDSNQSRNDRLAHLMRRMGIAEAKGSGIDKVAEAAEFLQLPAPRFREGFRKTEVVIYGPRSFDEMDRDDRVRACYQHCVLKWVTSGRMTNQTLRERFHLPERKSATVSQVISAAIEEGLIKSDETVGASRKYARYLPFWA
jgi:predicted HTH transcriptional regulator